MEEGRVVGRESTEQSVKGLNQCRMLAFRQRSACYEVKYLVASKRLVAECRQNSAGYMTGADIQANGCT